LWVHADHLKRPELMTDAARAVKWKALYKPFGEVHAITGPASLDMRFPGQWFQLEAGLAYNWHRHYDASLGRYTQPDPLGLEALRSDGPSAYGYAGQSPLMKVDPKGLQSNRLPFESKPFDIQCLPGKQTRFYGLDGKALLDIDWGHSHRPYPHVHKWEGKKRIEIGPYLK
jgi:RHS repeat-associated protein